MYTYRIEKNYFLKSIWNCAVWDSRRLKDVALMSLFFTIADFKQENVYFDSFFWLWNYIHLHNFFSNNKSLLSSTRTSYINVWNNKHWNVSERSNFLLHLEYVIWETTWLAWRDIPLTYMFLICQISFIFILCLHSQGWWRAYLPRSNSVRLARRLCECLHTSLN